MNSNLLVGKFYRMDPAVEDLLLGDQLQEGMVVLVESVALKADPSENAALFDPAIQNHMLKANRWCEVSNLRRIPTGLEVQIQFVGIYADGTKSVRIYRDTTGFYVKKDSLPDAVEHENAENTEGTSDLTDKEETVEFTQLGTGLKAQVPLSEVKEAGLIKETKAFIDLHSPVKDIQSDDGPLARALQRQSDLRSQRSEARRTDGGFYQ